MQRTLICFDYGVKRIGVAVGQELTRTANELETIKAIGNNPDWDSIARILKEWQPAALVLGLPLNDDGTETTLTKRVKKFSSALQEKYKLPVYYIDERLSSAEAESLIATSATKKRAMRRDKGMIDKVAAKLILQSWLDQIEY